MMDLNPDIVAALNVIGENLFWIHFQITVVSLGILYHIFWGKK